MPRISVTQEGAFDLGARNAVNANFAQLYAGQYDISAKTASTTLASADSGSIIALNVATGLTITLPAAMGTGNTFYFSVIASVTSNGYIVKVANSTDIFGGVATIGSSGGTSLSAGTAVDSDTITLNGTTTGGLKGTWIEVRDVASGLFSVSVHSVGSGVASTPFSATV